MAKATAKCKCIECGAEFQKTTTKNNRGEADLWEEWAEKNYTQCPQCWGREQRKKETETPLALNIEIDPYSLNNPILLWFSGNTIAAKDDIKNIGSYYWSDRPMSGTFGIFNLNNKMCWNKLITVDNMDLEIKKAKEIGAEINNNIKETDLIVYAKVKQEKDQEEAAKAEKMKDIKKPECPEILKGNKWNQKIYGKKGSYCFYGNNEKISITDKQKEDIEHYLKEKEVYQKAVFKIENSL